MQEPMVRKEFELTRDEAEKLKRVAAARGCSEEQLVQRAIDQLEAEAEMRDEEDRWRTTPGGLRIKMPRGLTPEEKEQLDELERWLAKQPYAGLSEAVIEERESGY